MQRLGGLVATLMLVSALAGCAGEEKAHDHNEHDHGDEGVMGDSGNETSNDTALAALITVTIDGNASQTINGSIPAVVGANITFDGSGSSGDNLTYAWDFGDNATGSAATETHAFDTPGRYNVTLTVSAGNASASSSVLMNITTDGPAPGTLVWTAVHDFSGTLLVGDPTSDSATLGGTNSIRTHPVPIVDVDPNGTTVLAKTARITLTTSTATALIVNVRFRAPDGTALATGQSNYNGGEMKNDHALTYEGDMPPGEYGGFVRNMLGANAQYTLHIEIDYYSV